mmetsp:Transcript_26408/g.82304  ORF Transcript_26408/g.82304 Transcript_26408/m.82304 type:complete len:267 (-) Transcript_26408:265-1065(-)
MASQEEEPQATADRQGAHHQDREQRVKGGIREVHPRLGSAATCKPCRCAATRCARQRIRCRRGHGHWRGHDVAGHRACAWLRVRAGLRTPTLEVADGLVQAREGHLALPVLPDLHGALEVRAPAVGLQVLDDGLPAFPGAPTERVLLGQHVAEEVDAGVPPHPPELRPVHAEVAHRLVNALEVHLRAVPHVVQVRPGLHRLAVAMHSDHLHGSSLALCAPECLQVSNRGRAVLPLAPTHQIELGSMVSQEELLGVSPHPAVLVEAL